MTSHVTRQTTVYRSHYVSASTNRVDLTKRFTFAVSAMQNTAPIILQYPRKADNLSGIPAVRILTDVAFLSWPLPERKLAARGGIEPQKPERIESLGNSKRAHLLTPHPRCFIQHRSTIRYPFHTVFPSRKFGGADGNRIRYTLHYIPN
jgi:hypothetical protein